jgi:DNA-binding SARP family transcriptional activator
MTKTVGRNDPCPCGSGKKYKKCCLDKDKEAETPSEAAIEAARQKLYDELEDLDGHANHVVNLIDDGQLDAAEAEANDLIRSYPNDPDGLEKLAMVHEARGDRAAAHATYVQLRRTLPNLSGFTPDKEYLDWLNERLTATAP